MKLLINLCAHDGIISHYTGVGTMVNRYIKLLGKYLTERRYDYFVNLITPEYNEDSFGYSEQAYERHAKMKNMKIVQISNGTNGAQNFGTLKNWQTLTKNTAKFINSIDIAKYDKVVTVFNDAPFTMLANYLKQSKKHTIVWLPHSTVKIHTSDVNTEEDSVEAFARLGLELEAIRFINKTKNCYVGCISQYMKSHLTQEFGLFKEKQLMLVNGEILDEKLDTSLSKENKEYLDIVNKNKIAILSFGRAEGYKNLEAAMYLGKEMGIPAIVIAQGYYKGQPNMEEYKRIAEETNSTLFIDPPFNLAKTIIREFKNKLIALVPSKKESMGLIVNEVRRYNKKNVLVVSNKINGLKEQISHGKDGLIVDLNNMQESAAEIKPYLTDAKIAELNKNSQITLYSRYDFEKNFNAFIKKVIKSNE